MTKHKPMDFTTATLMLNNDGKADKVVPSNFTTLHRAYAKVHQPDGRMGENINPIDHPSQWGAWRAYFKARGIGTAFMDQQGQRLANMSRASREAMCGYLVPCMFPGDFDAEWPAENDLHAGDKFVAAQNKKREEVKQLASMSAEDKQAVIRKAMAKFTQ